MAEVVDEAAVGELHAAEVEETQEAEGEEGNQVSEEVQRW